MTHLNSINVGDCLEGMRKLPADCVDLVFDSPPYSDARTYGIGFSLKGQAWVDWMIERTVEALRLAPLVCTVIEARTEHFSWGAEPVLLMADLVRRGIALRKPPVFHRVGVPGSGGPDWLRNDYEFIVCATRGGKLPWSDNTAMGHPPKWAPGGEMSNRLTNGARVNQWGHPIDSGATQVDADGVITSKGKRPSHVLVNGRDQWGGTGHASSGEGRSQNGQHKTNRKITKQKDGMHGGQDSTYYSEPVLANPGNVVTCLVGGGVMGSRMCHENEAPFPESLPEFFIRSFCKPGGVVLDRFCGSGTTAAVAHALGRKYITFDVRESQVKLAKRRLANVTPPLFAEA